MKDVILFAAASAGFAIFFRAFPWPHDWTEPPADWSPRLRWFLTKLFGCHACAGIRAAAVMLLVRPPDDLQTGVLTYFAAVPLAAYVHSLIFPDRIELPLPVSEPSSDDVGSD